MMRAVAVRHQPRPGSSSAHGLHVRHGACARPSATATSNASQALSDCVPTPCKTCAPSSTASWFSLNRQPGSVAAAASKQSSGCMAPYGVATGWCSRGASVAALAMSNAWANRTMARCRARSRHPLVRSRRDRPRVGRGSAPGRRTVPRRRLLLQVRVVESGATSAHRLDAVPAVAVVVVRA